MRKNITLSIIIICIGIFIGSCSTQNPSEVPTASPESATEEAQPVPTNTAMPAATDTAPPPTATAVPPSPTAAPSEAAPEMTATSPGGAATPEPTADQAGQVPGETTRVSEIDSMVQVFVPAGDFLMGSTDPEAKTKEEGGRAYPEIPQHTVYLDDYWIDKYEVTNAQYALCVEAGVCQAPYKNSSDTRPSYYGDPEFDNYPVIWVTWYMSKTYCEWAGRRQPTEAEWEKASRGTDGQKYPWGNDPVTGERANFCDKDCPRSTANGIFDDGYPDTAPVGSYPMGVSPYGAMDMSGNVWEWTSTLIRPYPYDPNDGRENPDVWGERVWRGGPWSNGYWWMRSSVRYRSIPSYWYVNLGIRCASSE